MALPGAGSRRSPAVTGRAVPAGSIAEVVAARAAAAPDERALAVDGGDDLTYGAWDGRSNAIARGLAARGIGAGDRVGLLFDGPRWADFAAAHLGVLKAGGVAVLLSPGAAFAELVRGLSHSGATGLLCAAHLAPSAGPVWAAAPEEVGRDHDAGPVPLLAGPATLAELIYSPAPLAPPRPRARAHGDLVPDANLDGWLVHAWAPGTFAGQHAMGLVLAGERARVSTLAVFDPDRLCALVADRRAVACGLTPVLAAAVVASGAPRRHDLRPVTRVVLSEPPSPHLGAGLRATFPHASVGGTDRATWPAPVTAPGNGGDAHVPVAVSQEGMLWHEQLTPGSFNLPCLVRRYEGRLDVAALQWALSELVRRHEPLRSTFEMVGGVPRQHVQDHHAVDLAVVDLGGLLAPERDAEAARLLAAATSRPFDLVTGPLFRPRLVRLGPDDHLLVVRLHHTVFDDWSVDVFRRELSALYAARVAGEPSPLLAPATSFGDFSRRQRALLAGEEGAAQRSWWRRELHGAPLAVQLPIGEPHGPGGSGGRRPGPPAPLRLDLPPALAAGLAALAPQLRATPYMTVLAAFSVLVARSTGLDDLLIASVVAHRNRSELEPLVGCFTKKIPLRLRLHGDPTFPDLVARTRASLLGALSHQDMAFDAAVQEALGPAAADHGVVPQVAVVFQGETPQQVSLALPGLATSRYESPVEARSERHFSAGPEKGAGQAGAPEWGDGIYLKTFLILSLLETGDGMSLVARGVFHRPGAQRLLESFQSLLAGIVAAPARRISELSASVALPVEPPVGGAAHDVVELRGFRASRSRIEAALALCPGAAEVALVTRHDPGGEPRLVAYVVARAGLTPTLAQLRHTLWAHLPGALWPCAAVVVDALHRQPDGGLDPAALAPPGDPVGAERPEDDTDPRAAMLAAMWSEVSGRPVGPGRSYWQDFSFLDVLAEARQAGLAVSPEQVARCRTPQMLGAAMAGAEGRERGQGPPRDARMSAT